MEITKEISNTKLVLLRDKIQNLHKKHHIPICKIFMKHSCDCSENKNGIFINLSKIPINIIQELYEYLNYIDTQEAQINILEDEKKIYEQLLTTPHSS